MNTFQDIILKLLSFWTNEGCILEQSHDCEVGAGTFNPSTFLRSLGPEPFKTVFVEPCRRPQDGRYGQNPNQPKKPVSLPVANRIEPIDGLYENVVPDQLDRRGQNGRANALKFL